MHHDIDALVGVQFQTWLRHPLETDAQYSLNLGLSSVNTIQISELIDECRWNRSENSKHGPCNTD